MPYMLGKLPPKIDSRSLKFANYLPLELPSLPAEVRWQDIKCGSSWGMDGNDRYGNCVIVTTAHILDCMRANESTKLDRISDADVIDLSSQMGAMNGYFILDRLKWWRNKGMFGSVLSAFCDVEKRHDHIRHAINIFGYADIGLDMPVAWEGRPDWDVGNGYDYQPGSWGGHSVPLLGYETRPTGLVYYLCSWGSIYTITQAAIDKYCDEIYTGIVPDWYVYDKLTPSQFNFEQLMDDLVVLDKP